MTYLLLLICIGLGALMLRNRIGFTAQQPEHYVDGQRFDIREHLNGPMICEGVLYGPLGRVSTRFVAQMHGHWDGNKGHLVENFVYESGEEHKREWFLTTHNNDQIDAEAPDVIGTGKGTQKGSAVQLKYRLQLPESGGGHVLDVTDWMYLLPNGTVVNRSQMRKFGIKVAELVATMRKAA